MIRSGFLAYASNRQRLTYAEDLVKIVHALGDVTNIADFLQFTRTDLRHFLPHSACGVVFGDLSRAGAPKSLLLTGGFPAELASTDLGSWSFFRPFVEAWRGNGEPQVFSAWDPSVPYALRRPLIETRLSNVAAAGVFGGNSACCSFFTFHGLPEPLQGNYQQTLGCVLPHLHCVLARLLFAPQSSTFFGNSRHNRLTRRETEILDWVRQGKTNAEIAAILGISHGTVKVQVQRVLVKLCVNTRAQAVAKALSKGLLRLTPGNV